MNKQLPPWHCFWILVTWVCARAQDIQQQCAIFDTPWQIKIWSNTRPRFVAVHSQVLLIWGRWTEARKEFSWKALEEVRPGRFWGDRIRWSSSHCRSHSLPKFCHCHCCCCWLIERLPLQMIGFALFPCYHPASLSFCSLGLFCIWFWQSFSTSGFYSFELSLIRDDGDDVGLS